MKKNFSKLVKSKFSWENQFFEYLEKHISDDELLNIADIYDVKIGDNFLENLSHKIVDNYDFDIFLPSHMREFVENIRNQRKEGNYVEKRNLEPQDKILHLVPFYT